MTLLILAIVMGCFIGWTIGANDAANSLGTAVGAKVRTVTEAVILICIFATLGALLEGRHVIKTVGKGIVPLNLLPQEQAMFIAVASCFAAGLWILIATYWKLPISTSHSIVGAVAGGGLALHATVYYKKLGDIVICWILTPIGAAILAYLIYLLFRYLVIRFVPKRWNYMLFRWLLTISGSYVAYSWGANDVANATGVIVGTGAISSSWAALIGAVAIGIGVATWGYRVMETIGSRITHLVPIMAFSAELASAVNVHIYTWLGIPVSTSHSIVGAVYGVGMIYGISMFNVKIFRDIIFAWAATPFISGVLSFLIIQLLLALKLGS